MSGTCAHVFIFPQNCRFLFILISSLTWLNSINFNKQHMGLLIYVKNLFSSYLQYICSFIFQLNNTFPGREGNLKISHMLHEFHFKKIIAKLVLRILHKNKLNLCLSILSLFLYNPQNILSYLAVVYFSVYKNLIL